MTFLPSLSPGLRAHISVPQPVPPGPYGPAQDPPITVPTPERIPPEIDEPVPEPTLPIREPGEIRPPQAAWHLGCGGLGTGARLN